MIQRGYWQHPPSQNVWAVELENGTPARCAGPFSRADVHPLLLPHLHYSTFDIDLLRAEWSLYVPYRLCSTCGTVLQPGAATAPNGSDPVHLRCSLKPTIQGDSVGAAVLAESLWQCSARLRHTSRVLRERSDRLQARCRSARVACPLPG